MTFTPSRYSIERGSPLWPPNRERPEGVRQADVATAWVRSKFGGWQGPRSNRIPQIDDWVWRRIDAIRLDALHPLSICAAHYAKTGGVFTPRHPEDGEPEDRVPLSPVLTRSHGALPAHDDTFYWDDCGSVTIVGYIKRQPAIATAMPTDLPMPPYRFQPVHSGSGSAIAPSPTAQCEDGERVTLWQMVRDLVDKAGNERTASYVVAIEDALAALEGAGFTKDADAAPLVSPGHVLVKRQHMSSARAEFRSYERDHMYQGPEEAHVTIMDLLGLILPDPTPADLFQRDFPAGLDTAEAQARFNAGWQRKGEGE